MFQIRNADLRKLNSLTRYPSIPTDHVMGEKGRLTDELSEDFSGEPVYATEKVDGTNSRIVFTPDGSYLIGSREEFLHAKGKAEGLVVRTAGRQQIAKIRYAKIRYAKIRYAKIRYEDYERTMKRRI